MDMLQWQKTQFGKPQEVIDIRSALRKQEELGRALTEQEVTSFVVGYRTANDGFTPNPPSSPQCSDFGVSIVRSQCSSLE